MTGHNDHRCADVRRGIEHFFARLAESTEESRIFLAAAAAESYDMDPLCGDPSGGGGETAVIGRGAIGVGAGWGIGPVEFEPFLGLLEAVIMELVIDLARVQRV